MLKTLFVFVWFFFHPVHVTITSIDYVPETDSFKVFVRLYKDDFILDQKLDGKRLENNDFSVDNFSSRSIMEKYLEERIIIKVNEKVLKGKLEKMVLEDNELSMNLEYGSGKTPRTLTVKNLIMTGLYKDQVNMIIVRINDFEEGIKLTSDLTEKTFVIK